MNENNRKLEENLETIKLMLLRVDEQPIIDNWAFFTWGIFILIGSILSWALPVYGGMNIKSVTAPIWITAFSLGGLFETIAMVVRVNKDSLALFSRRMLRVYLTLMVGFVGIFMIYVITYKASGLNYLPEISLITFGIMMSFYAHLSYHHLYYWAVGLIFSGLIVFLVDPDFQLRVVSSGAVMGIVFIGSGIQSVIRDRSRNDE